MTYQKKYSMKYFLNFVLGNNMIDLKIAPLDKILDHYPINFALLLKSIQYNRLDLSKYFVDNKRWDILNEQDQDGNTILHHAVKQNNKTMIQYLVINGCNLTTPNNLKKNAIDICHCKDLKIFFKQSKKIIHIINVLESHFPNPKPPLNHTNDFTFLIAVLLSAQTTDERVNKITPPLFDHADTPQKMSRLEIDTIASYIKTCGLYRSKANHISKLSQILIEKYNGHIPHKRSELVKLPGVGQKTAGVFIAQKTNGDAFHVDTHIIRCANRWELSTKQNPNQVEKQLCMLFPKYLWNKLHLQMIYYARQYSPARGFIPSDCKIQQYIDTISF